MLELLFQGFIEWIYGLILECWEYFASVLFDLMSLDFAYLREHMPVIDTIRQIMLGVGWALLIGNLVFQPTPSMICRMVSMMGICSRRYAKSRLIRSNSTDAKYSQHSRIRP